ncbi:MAG: CcdB family protein [Alphaproteobacteria bacterium]|nr:CcdB family protein [Alphaproteobacteria bacterium]
MIRQFDVFPNPLKGGGRDRPYVIVIQHPFFDDQPTRIVVPLVVVSAIRPQLRLNPTVTVQRTTLYFSPTEMFSLSHRMLRDSVANLEADRDKLLAAIDLVFTGI